MVRLGARASGWRGRAGPAAGSRRRQGRTAGHVGAALRTTAGATAATAAPLLRRVGGRVSVAVVVRRIWNKRLGDFTFVVARICGSLCLSTVYVPAQRILRDDNIEFLPVLLMPWIL